MQSPRPPGTSSLMKSFESSHPSWKVRELGGKLPVQTSETGGEGFATTKLEMRNM